MTYRFQARFTSGCHACGQTMRPADLIAYIDGHAKPVCGMCTPDEDPLAGGTPCPDCFLVHNGDCF